MSTNLAPHVYQGVTFPNHCFADGCGARRDDAIHDVPEPVDPMAIWDQVAEERRRAHAKHGANSMEERPPGDHIRLTILLEEVGEVAREYNEAAIAGRPLDWDLLRKELIQVAAMSGAWAEALTERAS